jgi:hypothetical protein
LRERSHKKQHLPTQSLCRIGHPRKLSRGFAIEDAANLDAMRNPESFEFFIDLAANIGER